MVEVLFVKWCNCHHSFQNMPITPERSPVPLRGECPRPPPPASLTPAVVLSLWIGLPCTPYVHGIMPDETFPSLSGRGFGASAWGGGST